MSTIQEYTTRDENIKEAKSEMQEFQEVVLPLLKEKKVFTHSDMEAVATLFYYAGSSILLLGQISTDRWEEKAKREQCKKLKEEYSAICREALDIMKAPNLEEDLEK